MILRLSTSSNIGVLDRSWDRTGILTSALCIAHCLLSPLLLGLVPVLAMAESRIHLGFIAILFVVGVLAFVPGRRKHGRLLPLILAAAGFAMLMDVVPFHEYLAGESGEALSTLLGGAVLITAHLANIQYCRRCRSCSGTPCRNLARLPQD